MVRLATVDEPDVLCVQEVPAWALRDFTVGALAARPFMGPIPITEGPAAGQAIVCFNAPWGLQLEAISYPKGMAYEKDAATILWSPRDPSK